MYSLSIFSIAFMGETIFVALKNRLVPCNDSIWGSLRRGVSSYNLFKHNSTLPLDCHELGEWRKDSRGAALFALE